MVPTSDPLGSDPFRCDPSAKPECDNDEDLFDLLPDPVLLVIFNKIGDVKALGRCSVVSKRFHSLVPLVDDVVVRVDCVISDDDPPSSSSHSRVSDAGGIISCDKARSVFSSLARVVIGGIVKPLQALGQILNKRSIISPSSALLTSSSSSSSEVSHHSPAEVLKNFKEIKSLKIQLPAGELGVDDGVLLKWKADFGSTLDSCVILGASSISSKAVSFGSDCAESCGIADGGNIPESFYTNGGLKLRVVWTISSLIAASARHYLLQPIINDHETLQSLDLTDADGQGVLTMGRSQLKEMRMKPVSASGSSQRTQVPALSMKMWYAPHLEIPGGVVLKGATLVAIRPSEVNLGENLSSGDGGSADGGCWVSNAFEEPYRTAARKLVKRRTYSLEMNSF